MNKTFFQAFYPEGIFVVPEVKLKAKALPILQEPELVEKEIVPEEKITYAGENHKRILILIDEKDTDIINNSDKEFLGKILIAIKLTYNDVALVNLAAYPDASLSSLESSISFTKMILFGDSLLELLKEHKIQKYKLTDLNDIEVLCCDSLADIQEDKTKKIKLWEELKKLIVS